MTNINELDIRLRAFINAPDNFLDSVALVNAFHQYPVWAAKKPYAIEIEGVRVFPVFTDKDDMATFKEEQKSAQAQYWVERSALTVLEEAVHAGAAGLGFNLKKKGDFGNSTVFKSADMIQFMNNYTTILNTLMSDDNSAADTLDRFIWCRPLFTLRKRSITMTGFFQPCQLQRVSAMFLPFQIFRASLNGTIKRSLVAFLGNQVVLS